MELTIHQKDSLTEVINIAFSRTAASLSELTGNRGHIDVPEVSVHPIGELFTVLGQFVSGDVATVHQIFAGPVAVMPSSCSITREPSISSICSPAQSRCRSDLRNHRKRFFPKSVTFS